MPPSAIAMTTARISRVGSGMLVLNATMPVHVGYLRSKPNKELEMAHGAVRCGHAQRSMKQHHFQLPSKPLHLVPLLFALQTCSRTPTNTSRTSTSNGGKQLARLCSRPCVSGCPNRLPLPFQHGSVARAWFMD